MKVDVAGGKSGSPVDTAEHGQHCRFLASDPALPGIEV